MLKKSELIQVIIAILLFEFIIFFPNNIDIRNILLILIPPIIILTNVITKRIAAPYYSIKIRHKIWEFQRFGFIEKSKLKKPSCQSNSIETVALLFSLFFCNMDNSIKPLYTFTIQTIRCRLSLFSHGTTLEILS